MRASAETCAIPARRPIRPPSLIALGAVAVIAGPKGQREVAVENFCTGPGKNVLAPGEFLVELKFPARPAHSGSHYRRFIPRNEMDIAVVGVAASVVLDDKGETFVSARIALGAVGPTPLFAKDAGALLGWKERERRDDRQGRRCRAGDRHVRSTTCAERKSSACILPVF